MSTSGLVNVEGASLDLYILRAKYERKLLSMLPAKMGPICMVLDEALSRLMSLLVSVETLRKNDVQRFFHLETKPLETDLGNVVYVIRPIVPLVKALCEQIKHNVRQKQRKNYTIIYMPERSAVCDRLIEREGVYGYIQRVHAYDIHLFPIEKDVLSMQMLPHEINRQWFMERDVSALYRVAKCLVDLQATYGLIPHVKGKGDGAQAVWNIVETLMKNKNSSPSSTTTPSSEEDATESVPRESRIDTLLIFDRSVDFVTPLCTQLTYEGLVDETIGIVHSFVDLQPSIVPSLSSTSSSSPSSQRPDESAQTITVAFNSNDILFAEIRDLNFSAVPSALHEKAQYINEHYNERYALSSVEDIRKFVTALVPLKQQHTSLSVHTALCEHLVKIAKDPKLHNRLDAEQSAWL